MNSYVSVKVSEALYDMKAQLVHTEEQIHKVIEEKEKMEVILKEKMEMIRVCMLVIFFSFFAGCLVDLRISQNDSKHVSS